MVRHLGSEVSDLTAEKGEGHIYVLCGWGSEKRELVVVETASSGGASAAQCRRTGVVGRSVGNACFHLSCCFTHFL